MCGRFTLTRVDYDDLARSLGAVPKAEYRELYKPRFNVAPTDRMWILDTATEDGTRTLEPARWGLINFWAKDTKRAAMQINARAEGVATSRAYREAFARRRCAVPADGYFEWTGSKKARQPIWFHRADGGLFLMAGLWEDWKNPATKETWRTFTVLTTAARGRVLNIHDRMPVILGERQVDTWLTAGPEEAKAELVESVRADLDEVLIPTEVSRKVNSVRNDDPSCLLPPGPNNLLAKGETGSLF